MKKTHAGGYPFSLKKSKHRFLKCPQELNKIHVKLFVNEFGIEPGSFLFV